MPWQSWIELRNHRLSRRRHDRSISSPPHLRFRGSEPQKTKILIALELISLPRGINRCNQNVCTTTPLKTQFDHSIVGYRLHLHSFGFFDYLAAAFANSCLVPSNFFAGLALSFLKEGGYIRTPRTTKTMNMVEYKGSKLRLPPPFT